MASSSAMQGGTMAVMGGSDVSTAGLIIRDTEASIQAGGLYVLDSTLTLSASTIENSTAPLGGAILDASLSRSNITISHSQLIQNGRAKGLGANAQLGWTERGGALVQQCTNALCSMHLLNTTFSNNSAEEGEPSS